MDCPAGFHLRTSPFVKSHASWRLCHLISPPLATAEKRQTPPAHWRDIQAVLNNCGPRSLPPRLHASQAPGARAVEGGGGCEWKVKSAQEWIGRGQPTRRFAKIYDGSGGWERRLVAEIFATRTLCQRTLKCEKSPGAPLFFQIRRSNLINGKFGRASIPLVSDLRPTSTI